MKKIKQDINDVLSLDDKTKLLKELNQENLLDLFKNSKNTKFKAIEPKKVSLDQQVSISIAREEKDIIANELKEIKKLGPAISISSFVRNRAIAEIDIAEWAIKAREGLAVLTSKEYDLKHILDQKKITIKMLEDNEDDNEQEYFLQKKLLELDRRLQELKKTNPQRRFRLSGRVTFNEANLIRWRAARLSITVADYMRFVLFGYSPWTDADKHMSIDSRKRFYISILDVAENGWGNPPQVNECANCARHLHDIQVLKEQLARYKSIQE